MSKPVAGSAPLRWGTAPLIPADLTEPDTTHMDEGWQDAEEPPHSYFNYWMNLVYLWLVYLDNITGEALTWTALETFNAGMVAANPSGAALSATSTFAASGSDFYMTDYVGTIKGVATISDGGYGAGLFGIGQAGDSLSAGVGGLGGVAQGINAGGLGGRFMGGPRKTAGAVGGAGWGIWADGGYVDGALNTSVAAGVGANIRGGDVLSDANGRRGGIGLRVAGGIGQAGYGHAIDVLSGDVNFAGGANTNLTMGAGSTATVATLGVTGNAAVTGTLTGTGLIHALGSLTVDSVMQALNALVTADLAVGGNTTLTGILTANGGALIVGTTAMGAATSNTLVVAGNAQASTLTATASGSSITPPTPTSLTYAGTWGTVGTTPVQYWKDAFGVVHIQGACSGGGAATIGTLPAGFRPTQTRDYACINSANTALHIQIDTGGVIQSLTTLVGSQFLDGISFRTT